MKASSAGSTVRMTLAVGVVGTCAAGCGASIQAIYEGDVRFEHCMALDAQPHVRPPIRRACWVEWVTFYTYGQTRDRVAHAQLRIQQLDGGAELVKSNATHPEDGPMPQLGKSTSALRADDAARLASCRTSCSTVNADCMAACEGPDVATSCRPGCAAGLRECERQCR